MNRDEIMEFRKNLRILEREIGMALEGETTCCGVTMAQCHVLLELYPGGSSVTGLSEKLFLDKSTLSRTVESLVKLGLVCREPNPSDRRSLPLSLTPLGVEKALFIHRLSNEYYGGLFNTMPEEKQAVVAEGIQLMAQALAMSREKGRFSGCCEREANR